MAVHAGFGSVFYAATRSHPSVRSLDSRHGFVFSDVDHFAGWRARILPRPTRTIRRLRSTLFSRRFRLLYRSSRPCFSPGLPFAITLLTILLAHELGHYFACRHHHIHSTYPFFIPAPTLIGTFGAFILIRSPIRSARALFDVGASGPLVGFLVGHCRRWLMACFMPR